MFEQFRRVANFYFLIIFLVQVKENSTFYIAEYSYSFYCSLGYHCHLVPVKEKGCNNSR